MTGLAACLAVAVLYFTDAAFRHWADNVHNAPAGIVIGIVLVGTCLAVDARRRGR